MPSNYDVQFNPSMEADKSSDDAVALDSLVESHATPPPLPAIDYGISPTVPDETRGALITGTVLIPAGQVGPIQVLPRDDERRHLILRITGNANDVPLLGDDASKVTSTMLGYPLPLSADIPIPWHTGTVWVGLAAPATSDMRIAYVSVTR